MDERFTINNDSLTTELQKVRWEKYIDYAQVKVTIKDGKVTMVYIEQSFKP